MGFPYPYPLGLPKGTVRATLTLSLSVNLLYLTYAEIEGASIFASAVAVALAFYFGGKIRAGDPTLSEKSAAERAFALPSGTVRLILILLYAGFSAYLYSIGRPIPDYLLEVIYIIAGYIIGAIFRKIFFKKKEDKVSLLQHLKSLLAIVITALAIFYSNVAPQDTFTLYTIQAASLFLGFYFGSRD